MSARKIKTQANMKNSIDYFNFCTANNDLPVLDIINERFSRSLRVSLSNQLRTITNIEYSLEKMTFSNWLLQNKEHNCIFIVNLEKISSSMLIKLDRKLAYAVIDILTGGNGQGSFMQLDKEMTQIELGLLKEIGDLMIDDLNLAWNPVHQIRAKYARCEINPQFINIVAPESRVIQVNFNINFNGVEGQVKMLYPYSTLFPFRNELYSNER